MLLLAALMSLSPAFAQADEAPEEQPEAPPPPEYAAEAAADEAPPEEKEEFPTAGYEKNGFNGFFIQSKDGLFRLNIGGYTQLRYNMNWIQDPDNDGWDFQQGFSVPRTRFLFEGKFSKWFNYHMRINIDGEGDFTFLVGYVQVNFAPGWYVRGGVQFFPLSREDWMFGHDILGIEFSPNDFTLAIGASAGALFHYGGKHGRVWFGVSNGAYGGKETFPSREAADVAFTTRAEFLLGSTDWSPFDNLVGARGKPFGVMLGVAGGYQLAKTSTTKPPHGMQAIGDISIAGNGFQFMAAGTFQMGVLDDSSTDITGGFQVGGGYLPLDWLHIFTRYDLIHPGDEDPTIEPFNQLALGVSAIPFTWTRRIRFTIEGSYMFNALDSTLVAPSGSLGLLASDEPGQFSLRTQAQIGF